MEHSNGRTIEEVGGGGIGSLEGWKGREGCNGGTIEVVGGGGVYIVEFLVNELGVKGLVLPFPPNAASLDHSNGGTIEVVGKSGR